ncbi:MAG: RsmB/NOP family class I SAM-dependent RNA methyltransferase [Candidatus Thorarchaeota archaeon]|nr:MAG: SAM-dependent tRNA/rRNA cytosine-C5 methylase [Candidatus Thorarchaeota archaeon]
MSRRQIRDRAKVLAQEYGYLQYMIERYLSLWGEEETLRFLEACEEPVRTSIRMNTLKASVEQTAARLNEKGVDLQQVEWLECGFYADFHGFSPGALLEHMLGHYYVQGVPSMTVVQALDPQPHETVLDLAAAPGGKTTHLAQMMNNTGSVIAIEQDRLRVASLQSNVMRCGVENAIVYRGDARKIEHLELDPDRILLDAPCSGEGLIPLDSSRKTSKTMADVRFCATREDELLDAAVRALKPGGVLVYSTCSIAPEENEYVVDEILGRHPELRIVPIDLDFGDPGYTNPFGVSLNDSLRLARRFLPHNHGTEGFFICKMEKESESD